MNYGENITKVLLLIIIFIAGFATYNLIDINKKSTKFYEYEKGKINLLQVSKINPRVEYYATLSQDENLDINRKYSTTLNLDEISNIETFLATTKDSEFYNIEINTYMMFDNQRVNIYKSPRYVQLPSHYQVNDYMLSVLKVYGIDEFQYEGLMKLKEKIFEGREKFIDSVISVAKLNRSEWVLKNIPILGLGEKSAEFLTELDSDVKERFLSDSEIKIISEKLHGSYSSYMDIK